MNSVYLVLQWAKSPHDCRKNSSLSSCNFSRLLPGAPAKTPPVPLPVPLVSLNDAVPVGNGIKRVLERVSSLPALVTAPKEPPPGFRAQILESGAQLPFKFQHVYFNTEWQLLIFIKACA